MKNLTIVLLCIFLAAAIVFGFFSYNRNLETKNKLQIIEEKTSDSNQTLTQLNQEISSRNDQVQKLQNELDEKNRSLESLQSQIASKDTLVGTLREQISMAQTETVNLKSAYDTLISELTDLKKNKETLPQLESSILAKDQELSQAEEDLDQLETDYKTEIMTREALTAELSSKGAWVAELQEKLKKSQTRIQSLESDIANSKSEIETLRNQLSDLKQEKDVAENRMSQLQGKYESVLGDLNELKMYKARISELEGNLHSLEEDLKAGKEKRENLENELASKESDITELHNQLEERKSWVTSLENELGKDKSRLERLQDQHAKLAKEKSLVENKLGQMQTTYDSLVKDLKQQIQNQEVTIDTFQKKISVTFVDRILFKTGKSTITPEGAKVLRKVGKTLKNVKDKKIRVVGHTDDVPIIPRFRYKYPSNWELSAARAARVIRFFQEEVGLDPTKLEAVGRSFYDPIASNDTPKGRALNRRVNIIIAPSIQ